MKPADNCTSVHAQAHEVESYVHVCNICMFCCQLLSNPLGVLNNQWGIWLSYACLRVHIFRATYIHIRVYAAETNCFCHCY